ncbi:MAG: hypothetical protein AAF922_15900 [Pseudomonadota bacterium]
MKKVIAIITLSVVAACSSPERFSTKTSPLVTRAAPSTPLTANGPLKRACLASDRQARSRALCGCIQAAANQTLTVNQQQRAVSFYGNLSRAQEVRQSDRNADEAFWNAYRTYGERAERMCQTL